MIHIYTNEDKAFASRILHMSKKGIDVVKWADEVFKDTLSLVCPTCGFRMGLIPLNTTKRNVFGDPNKDHSMADCDNCGFYVLMEYKLGAGIDERIIQNIQETINRARAK